MAIVTCGSGNALLRHGLLAPCVSRSAHQGRTPLHLAALGGRETVCALLLDRGASLEARTIHVIYLACVTSVPILHVDLQRHCLLALPNLCDIILGGFQPVQ